MKREYKELSFLKPKSRYIMDMFNVVALIHPEDLNIDREKTSEIQWISFMLRNKRQRERGKWNIDPVFIDVVRQITLNMGYKVGDIKVLIQKEEYPVIFNVYDTLTTHTWADGPEHVFSIAVAPRDYP